MFFSSIYCKSYFNDLNRVCWTNKALEGIKDWSIDFCDAHADGSDGPWLSWNHLIFIYSIYSHIFTPLSDYSSLLRRWHLVAQLDIYFYRWVSTFPSQIEMHLLEGSFRTLLKRKNTKWKNEEEDIGPAPCGIWTHNLLITRPACTQPLTRIVIQEHPRGWNLKWPFSHRNPTCRAQVWVNFLKAVEHQNICITRPRVRIPAKGSRFIQFMLERFFVTKIYGIS